MRCGSGARRCCCAAHAASMAARIVAALLTLGCCAIAVGDGPPAASRGATACVVSSPHPEFAASPLNYAHWLLAHAYPTVVALDATGAAFSRIRFGLALGENELLRTWAAPYASLLRPANVSFGVEFVTLRTEGASVEVPLGKGASSASRACAALGLSDCASVKEALRGLEKDAMPPPTDCDVRVAVSAPHLSFCDDRYWRGLPAFAASVRRRYPVLSTPETPRLFVLRRAPRDDEIGRRWDVSGLSALCEAPLLQDAVTLGVAVECGAFDQATPLGDVAKTLGRATAFVAAHGAGLANVVFLPRGAAVFELDAADHAPRSRQFYQVAARELGLRPEKVWLDATGLRQTPGFVGNCTFRRPDGSRIDGNGPEDLEAAGIVDYKAPATLSADVARALLRVVAARGVAGIGVDAAPASEGVDAAPASEGVDAAPPPASRRRRPRDSPKPVVVWTGPTAACAVVRKRAGEPASDGCEAVVEREWLVDEVLRGAEVVACPDVDCVRDGAVYVVHAAAWSADARNAAKRLGLALRRNGYRSALVHLSDEGGAVDDFYEPWPVIWRQYYSEALAERWGAKLRFLPLGYASGHRRLAPTTTPASTRPLAWFFGGDARPPPGPKRRGAFFVQRERVF